MRRLLTLFLCLALTSCSTVVKVRDVIEPQPLSNQKIVVKVRIHYQKNLAGILETRFNLLHSFTLLEKELNVKFQVVGEGQFEFEEPLYPSDVPSGLAQDLHVMVKGNACSATHVDDGSATICIFSKTISPPLGEEAGIVLGAQHGPIIILSNLDNPVGFVNVARHEIGHLLGAPHSEDLMAPGLGDIGLQKILPFPKEAIDSIRVAMGIQNLFHKCFGKDLQ